MGEEEAKSKQGNIHDLFVKSAFAHVELLADFLRWYAEPKLLRQLDLRKIKQEPSHFVGEEGRERIADLIFTISGFVASQLPEGTCGKIVRFYPAPLPSPLASLAAR